MKRILGKMVLLTIVLPIIAMFANIYIGGKIAFAAEPTVKIQKPFTWDTRVEEIKQAGDGYFYFAEDGRVYFGFSVTAFSEGTYFGTSYTATPVEVILENNQKIKDVTGYKYNIFIITDTGNVYARGDNRQGILGLDEKKFYNEFTKINTISNVIKVKTVEFGTWFIKENYTYAVGINKNNALGIGSTTSTSTLKAVLGGKVEDIYTLSGGGDYNETYFCLENGAVYACGHGYLGNSNSVVTNIYPRSIIDDTGGKVKGIYVFYGDDDFRLLFAETGIYIWGYKVLPYEVLPYSILRGRKITKIIQGYDYVGIVTENGGFYIINSNGNYYTITESSEGQVFADTRDCSELALYVKEGKLYDATISYDSTNIDIPYVIELGEIMYRTSAGEDYCIYVNTVDGMYYLKINIENHTIGAIPVSAAYDIASQLQNGNFLGKNGEVYSAISYLTGNTMTGKIGGGIESYRNGHYFGFDGAVYINQRRSIHVDGSGFISYHELEKLGVSPYPRKDKLIMEGISSNAIVRYAFSMSDTYEGVTSDEWKIYDESKGGIILNPSISGVYYTHIEITQNGEIYTYVFGPYEVKLNGDTISSKNDYAYISADMRIPDAMTATFNVIFTPPSDIFLSNGLNANPDRMFIGIIKNGLVDIKVYDAQGNDISDKLDPGYVVELYKNGVYVGDATDNYLFKKRDEGALTDNVYILKLNVGGANLFTGVGNQYKLEFNGLRGYDSITMQNFVPINTHKFALNVYVTELPSLA